MLCLCWTVSFKEQSKDFKCCWALFFWFGYDWLLWKRMYAYCLIKRNAIMYLLLLKVLFPCNFLNLLAKWSNYSHSSLSFQMYWIFILLSFPVRSIACVHYGFVFVCLFFFHKISSTNHPHPNTLSFINLVFVLIKIVSLIYVSRLNGSNLCRNSNFFFIFVVKSSINQIISEVRACVNVFQIVTIQISPVVQCCCYSCYRYCLCLFLQTLVDDHVFRLFGDYICSLFSFACFSVVVRQSFEFFLYWVVLLCVTTIIVCLFLSKLNISIVKLSRT